MITFWQWVEARRWEIDPGVLHGYDLAFKDRLKELIARTIDPGLRAKLVDMLDCPVRDGRGNCRNFAEYIFAALVKNGIHNANDIESAMQYVVTKMLMDRSELTGKPKPSLFSGFTERPHSAGFNPLQARFFTFLQHAIDNIRLGRIPRLLDVERRPPGTLSIGQGGEDEGRISPEKLADRPSSELALKELIGDITELLRHRQQDSGLPLVAIFQAMMSGQRSDAQRKIFGDRTTRAAREAIVHSVRSYALSTGNHAIQNLLARLENGETASREVPIKPRKPILAEKDRDYRSIVSVIERFNHPVGSAVLGRYRRRWLGYSPRDPSSGHRNRLEEVLEAMVGDEVLRATKTSKGAVVYSPGPRFDQYRASAVA